MNESRNEINLSKLQEKGKSRKKTNKRTLNEGHKQISLT